MSNFKDWKRDRIIIFVFFIMIFLYVDYSFAKVVKVGLLYPQSGKRAAPGLELLRTANITLQEINNLGGILGNQVELVWRDTQSDPDIALQGAIDLIEHDNVKVIFGCASSRVAVEVSNVCQEKRIIFMPTIAAANEITLEHAHRHTFRVCYNSWMSAKALSSYLNKNFQDKKYFYLVSDYNWGWSAEELIRKFTNTQDISVHKRVLIPVGVNDNSLKKSLVFAKMVSPDVLVFVLSGNDLSLGIRIAAVLGLKTNCQIVVPFLELTRAEESGPKVMQGVVGTADWNWTVPYKYNYENGKKFVENFAAKYKRYPGWGAYSVYTDLIEYKSAVERAKTFDSSKVIKALEGHKFTWLKDEQVWQAFDHQCIQSVYIVKCRPQIEVLKDKFKLNYFEVIERFSGDQITQSYDEWKQARQIVNLPIHLEKLPDD